MQGNVKLRILIVFIVMLCLFLLSKTCRSKAENEIHYGPEFSTPDPNQGVYDVIPSDEPSYPYFPDLTWQPIPLPTGTPDDITGLPYPVQLKYDPFFAYVDQNTGAMRYKRLNGTISVINPPISTSILHGASATSVSVSDGDTNGKYLKYISMPVSGLTQSNTLHDIGQGSLLYFLFQSFDTQQGNYRVGFDNHLVINFKPHVRFRCTDSDLVYNPLVTWKLILMFKTNESLPGDTYVRIAMITGSIDQVLNDGSDEISIDIDLSEYAAAGLEYVYGYNLNIAYNGIDGVNNVIDGALRDAVNPQYYFDQTADPEATIFVWEQQNERGFFAGLFEDIKNFFVRLFVPQEEDIQAWVEYHTSDELDPENPLNVVKDTFVFLMEFFNGQPGSSRPAIDIPALSFDLEGYGKVTYFNGYTWNLTANTPTDGAGNSLWYYVKLANSCVLATGLFELLYRYFKKWYDLHYSGG